MEEEYVKIVGKFFILNLIHLKKEGVCDNCGGKLYQRDDDTVETVEKRIEVYHKQTEPLIDYYNKKRVNIKCRWFKR